MTARGPGREDPADGVRHLRDGTAVTLRPIEQADADGLIVFHEGLSEQTSRRRFFGFHPHLSVAEVARFTSVDLIDRAAFVVTAAEQIVAVGRLDRPPGASTADVAFVVSDAWQHRGVGTLLLGRLVVCARSIGVDRLVADTLRENRPMIELLHHSGLVTALTYDRDVLRLTLTLSGDGTP